MMVIHSEIEREPAAAEPRVLHAVVEDRLQRTGRMELRRRLLEAIVDGRNSVSWELRDGRLHSSGFRPDDDLQFPSPDEDTPETRQGARILFDLWTNDVRYLADLSRSAQHGFGIFGFDTEDHSIPVHVNLQNNDDSERVELCWDEVIPDIQEAARRMIRWHEQYRFGHCPVSPFAEADVGSPRPKRRGGILGLPLTIGVTALSGLGGAAALTTFAWPVVVGSFLWGLVVVPLIGWFALNRLTASLDVPENCGDDSTELEPRERTWSLRFSLFCALMVAILLLPAAVAGNWSPESEAICLAMATFFGLMLFLWGGILFYRPLREPELEPL
jgi:hypothetical protein